MVKYFPPNMKDFYNSSETYNGPLFERGQTVRIDASFLCSGALLASQLFVKPSDIVPARAYVEGDTSFYDAPPILYIARLVDVDRIHTYIIVGDGHHRIGTALINGEPIDAVVDYILEDIDLNELALIHNMNPGDLTITSKIVREKIIQRGSYTGISDIIPFPSFIQILSNYLEEVQL